MYDDRSKNGALERAPQTTTTDSGIPAASDEHSLTVGADGPIVLHDHYVVQKMQALNRERVPERGRCARLSSQVESLAAQRVAPLARRFVAECAGEPGEERAPELRQGRPERLECFLE